MSKFLIFKKNEPALRHYEVNDYLDVFDEYFDDVEIENISVDDKAPTPIIKGMVQYEIKDLNIFNRDTVLIPFVKIFENWLSKARIQGTRGWRECGFAYPKIYRQHIINGDGDNERVFVVEIHFIFDKEIHYSGNTKKQYNIDDLETDFQNLDGALLYHFDLYTTRRLANGFMVKGMNE